MSDSLRPHKLQHTRLPYLITTSQGYSNSCSLSQRCHPTISPSVALFFSCPQSFPASVSFQMSQLFESGSKRTGVSASAGRSNECSRLISFRIDWFDLLAVQGILKSLFQYHSSKASILSLLYGPILTSIHDRWKNHRLD